MFLNARSNEIKTLQGVTFMNEKKTMNYNEISIKSSWKRQKQKSCLKEIRIFFYLNERYL